MRCCRDKLVFAIKLALTPKIVAIARKTLGVCVRVGCAIQIVNTARVVRITDIALM